MTTTTFDTLRFAERLEAAGLTREQARAISEAFKEATGEELVTKSYLDLRLAELRVAISETRSSIIQWVAALLIAQAAAITALVKLL
jgi:hypothetical protein